MAAAACTFGWWRFSRPSRRFRRFSSRSSPRCCSRAGSTSGSPIAPAGCSKTPSSSPRPRYNREVDRVATETLTASGDLADYLQHDDVDDPRFQEAFARNQVLNRNLSEAIIFTYGPDKQIRTLALVDPYDRPLDNDIPPTALDELNKRNVVPINSPDRIGAVTKLDYGPNTYLYAARVFDPQFRKQIERANDVLSDYRALLKRSRVNQMRFNAALLLGSLIIVGLVIFTALKIADRMVRPVGELVTAAGRIETGDFSARVPVANDGGRSPDACDRLQPDGRTSGRADDRAAYPPTRSSTPAALSWRRCYRASPRV